MNQNIPLSWAYQTSEMLPFSELVYTGAFLTHRVRIKGYDKKQGLERRETIVQ